MALNCHPFCGTCFKSNTYFACQTAAGGAELSYYVATCPTFGEHYSFNDAICKPVLTSGCDSYCRGQCFEINDEFQCVLPCENGKFLSTGTGVCSCKDDN